MSLGARAGELVLVVDDDEQLNLVISAVLRRLGYPTVCVTSVEAAIARLATERFGLVLLDLGLPTVSGHALLRELEGNPGAPPIIVMSGGGTMEDVIEALRRHAIDYLRKPFRPEELSSAISRALAEHRAPPAAPAPPPPEAAPPPPPPEAVSDESLSVLLRARIERLAVRHALSPREREVLDLVLLGLGQNEIGAALAITPRTAKFHLANLLEKLGAESRADLLRLLI